ncbi:hypothetical protein [Chryseobacterium camelliae]|uniref:CRP-like cAMP-binding protein n=1 Tax=Chryseobacterium camelliae TaxID=1265445 RepID=A0ABU0TKM0_9FLAO|nr:hypothetical protein [Chryseobacterium camelliae]MDQ1101516.1 CRP-like cAMP-binding protein [Chryseobacterium sp. SORGH_AS_1048]MDR6084959.1 CRP-like cAMP-binding protein [Chryseobacterium sp. SORGH_AS_0909]MDR6129312.1 CRP-like cAMP-binding protein [Chryseobacterium sp. SORGH_AS_1175]MDT3408558.1 CRP-like cAMP-binding protein [Pseudacidovorax intermedius]MDQ1097587.1 CRP-like cAMP-binding protein [Chryseobacterium camelliae]
MQPNTETIQKIKNIFTRHEFPAKTKLVLEQKIADNIYYVESGAARVWLNHDGKEITIR